MSTDRMDASCGQSVGHSDNLSTQMDTKPLLHSAIKDMAMRRMSGQSGRMGNAPQVRLTPEGADPNAIPCDERSEAVISIQHDVSGLTHAQLRDQAIHLLDAAHRHFESARLNRYRYMALGRKYGLSWAEVGVLVDMSADGARKSVQRVGAID